MYLKTHASPDGEIVALCDIELIGKVLVSVSADFQISKTVVLAPGSALMAVTSPKAVVSASVVFVLFVNVKVVAVAVKMVPVMLKPPVVQPVTAILIPACKPFGALNKTELVVYV